MKSILVQKLTIGRLDPGVALRSRLSALHGLLEELVVRRNSDNFAVLVDRGYAR